MKKFPFIISILSLLVFTSACSKENLPEPNSTINISKQLSLKTIYVLEDGKRTVYLPEIQVVAKRNDSR